MGVDEQKEEREVLESIFPDEITGTFCPVNDKSYISIFSSFAYSIQTWTATHIGTSVAVV